LYGSVAWSEAIRSLILMMAPAMPHISEELWQQTVTARHADASRRMSGGAFSRQDSVHCQAWPAWDPALVKAETVTLVVQINGKMRDRLDAPAGLSEGAARDLALASPAVQRWLEGKQVTKVIFAAGRLINIVAV
jgi:leucyl-tRNA synthetase